MAPVGYDKRELDTSKCSALHTFRATRDWWLTLMLAGDFAPEHFRPATMHSAEAEFAAAPSSEYTRDKDCSPPLSTDLGILLKGQLCSTADNEAATAICEVPADWANPYTGATSSLRHTNHEFSRG